MNAIRTFLKPLIFKILGPAIYEWLYYIGKVKDIKNGNFAENEQFLFKEFIKEGDEAIDIGANYGHVAVLFSRLCGPSGKIYAFEPIPFTYRINLKILKRFKCNNVHLENIGIGQKNENIDFKVPVLDFGALDTGLAFNSNRNFLEHKKFNTYNVKVVKLDDLIGSKIGHITFVKIDIEGAEYFALKGMEQILLKFKPTILIEICPDYIKGFGITLSEFELYLKDTLGYNLFTLSPESLKLHPIFQLTDANILLIHKDKINQFTHLF